MSLEPPLNIGWPQLMIAAALVLVALGLSAWQRLGLGKSLAIGTLRAIVQLIAVGYVLLWVFAANRWYLVCGVLLLMVMTASFTATRRLRAPAAVRRRLNFICSIAILAGSGLTLAYVGAVIHVTPWYNPRYLIPLFGMIVANAMNAAALGAERLQSEMDAGRAQIEAYLALGASAQQASAEQVRRALIASLIPTVNMLAVMGIVALPGMMTGQILAGISPNLAVRYQLVVVFMLTSATAITSAGVVLWYRRSFFSAATQLLPPAELRA